MEILNLNNKLDFKNIVDEYYSRQDTAEMCSEETT